LTAPAADPLPAGRTPDPLLPAPRSVRELFVAFTLLALQGFGGVLPVAQRELVDKRRWLTREQFVETLSVGQVLPGPNIVNVALMIGDRFFGWRGALAALAGMLAAPLVIVLALAILYARFAELPMVAGAMRGMGAVAAGLILGMGVKLAPTLKKNPLPLVLCAAAALASWVVVGLLRVPMAWLVLGLGSTMVGFAWWWLARKAPQP
jgi:chromate transporter